MTDIDYQNHPDPWSLMEAQPGFDSEALNLSRRELIQDLRKEGVSPADIVSRPDITKGLLHAQLAEDLERLRETRQAIEEIL